MGMITPVFNALLSKSQTEAHFSTGGTLQQRLQSILTDGERVEPAPAEPENDPVREARESNGELARE